MKLITADYLLQGSTLHANGGVLVDDGGRIAGLGPIEELASGDATRIDLGPRVLMPGLVNSHSHAFQIMARGTSDAATSFRHWVDSILYPLVERIDRSAIEAAALLAFSEMVRSGITTVGEFWYIHNEQGSNARLGNELDELVIDCARRVGLRICLLRTLYDQGSKPGQQRFIESPGEALGNLRALVERYRGDPHVSVGAAPHSLHGASGELIQQAAEQAEALDLPLHIHLAEQQGDLAVSREKYGVTPGRALEKLGVMSDRLTVVHGVWLDEEEIALLGAADAGLAYNPQSNMALGDGITNITAFWEHGVPISLGVDGACANDEVDILLEARLAEYLQRVHRQAMGNSNRAASDSDHVSPLLDMATVNGGHNLRLPIGRLEPGAAADVIAIDLHDPSLWPQAARMQADTFTRSLLLSSSARAVVTDVFVGGEAVVHKRKLVKLGWDEIQEKVRAVRHIL